MSADFENKNNEIDNKPYLIPRNVITRYQIFPGVGWMELIIIALALLVGGVLIWLLGFLTDSVVRYLLLPTFGGAAFYLFAVNPSGHSFYDVIRWMNIYANRKKRYLNSREGDY